MLLMTGYMFRNAEYVVTLQQLLNIKSRTLQDYKRAFDKLDRDGSGYIEVKEVADMLRDFYDGEPAPRYEVDAFVHFFDRNKDGKVSWQEFVNG